MDKHVTAAFDSEEKTMSINIKKIGVIGAGQMGSGIAHVCAQAGFDVHMLDISDDAIAAGMEKIQKGMTRQVSRGELSEADLEAAMKHITTGTDYAGFGDCDFVVEAASEDEDVKKAILKQLCPVLREDALIASNTSSISITRLGAQTDRPGKFLGMHFMNPVPRMELVELIRGIDTDEDTYSAIRELAAEHRVPLVEAPPLARALYRSCDLDDEIPSALYQAVAQVLSYVYQLRELRSGRRTEATPTPKPPRIDEGLPNGQPD